MECPPYVASVECLYPKQSYVEVQKALTHSEMFSIFIFLIRVLADKEGISVAKSIAICDHGLFRVCKGCSKP